MEVKIIPCIIRVNTKELQDSLENLGYNWWSCEPEDPGIATLTYNFKAQSESSENKEEPIYVGVSEDCFQEYIDSGFLDCGVDVNLFLTIASYRGEEILPLEGFIVK